MWKKRLMVLCWGWNETSCRILYFLMAATAFLAASSRSSAAKMGRPLSVRILLASWTLVPEKGQKKGRKTVLQQATTNITKMAKQGWTWSAICTDVKNHTVWKTKSSSGGINPHRQMESWVNGGTCNCWSERRRVWTTGKRAICVRVCVSAPPAVVRSGVAGAGWYGDACAPSRPTTNQRERKRKTLGDTLCNPEALRTELAASQHCTPLGQMQAWQACHNTGQGAPQRTEGRRKGSGWEQERGSERGGGAGGAAEQKVKWSKIGPSQLKTTKASCLCGIYWFDTWRTKTESVWCAVKDSARCWNI